ncbi:MAG: ribosome maturation factor RimP [Bryobacteraceae bacterium]
MAEKNRDAVRAKILDITERAAQSEGIEVVDVEILGGGSNRVVRIYIDRPPAPGQVIDPHAPQGVTHEDCELISNHVGTVLDVEDVIPGGAYTLEVSSPGIERKLTRPRDFERFVGQKVKVTLRQPVEKSRHWTGALTGFAAGVITLEPAPGKLLQFPLDQVEKANLKFDW